MCVIRNPLVLIRAGIHSIWGNNGLANVRLEFSWVYERKLEWQTEDCFEGWRGSFFFSHFSEGSLRSSNPLSSCCRGDNQDWEKWRGSCPDLTAGEGQSKVRDSSTQTFRPMFSLCTCSSSLFLRVSTSRIHLFTVTHTERSSAAQSQEELQAECIHTRMKLCPCFPEIVQVGVWWGGGVESWPILL